MVSVANLGRPAGGELGLRADVRCGAGLGGGEDVVQRAAMRAAAVTWRWRLRFFGKKVGRMAGKHRHNGGLL